MRIKLEAKVWGKVQGVFFRQNTAETARNLGLVGWVRNEADGSVGIVAEGEETRLVELLKLLKKGPGSSKVEKIDSTWTEAANQFDNFEIKY